ncbi:hypothetical protein ACE1CI_18145 [Aerosakkonemataceae cyanobacterium BLCC-F50]|uniref:Uncharacterized protein n=1 Tax=Floridaenema flaviceps BLCC-F50 TaxID=3153642 RepID=A0ABV4XSY5_9CYAN
MKTLIVLFNLTEGQNADDYERWAENTDLSNDEIQQLIQHFRRITKDLIFIVTEQFS